MGRKRRFGWTHTEYASMLDDAAFPVITIVLIVVVYTAYKAIGF